MQKKKKKKWYCFFHPHSGCCPAGVVWLSAAPSWQHTRDTLLHWEPTDRSWSQGRPFAWASFPRRQQLQQNCRTENRIQHDNLWCMMHALAYTREKHNILEGKKIISRFSSLTHHRKWNQNCTQGKREIVGWCWPVKDCRWISQGFNAGTKWKGVFRKEKPSSQSNQAGREGGWLRRHADWVTGFTLTDRQKKRSKTDGQTVMRWHHPLRLKHAQSIIMAAW